ncbi:MAG TPA: HlyD family efflux transporter periplasmic adaptor subunit [Longimicrobium sp.]|nr:HlyD family efflux transporter periplasmic adaptor subunit [Longimicrobium sp.]
MSARFDSAPGGAPSPGEPRAASPADAPAPFAADAAALAGMPVLVDPPGQWITMPSGERIFMLDQAPTPAPSLEGMPVLVDPPGQWITMSSGERIFMLDQAPSGPAASIEGMPVLVDPPGQWITMPSGERIFMVDQAPAAAAPVDAAPADAAPAWASPRGGFAPSPDAERFFVPDDDDDDDPPSGRMAPANRLGGAAPAAARGSAPAEIELQGEGLSEIVTLVPGRLARTGIWVICGVFAILLALASIVRYPEMVRGTAIVTTPEPPVRVAAALGGAIDRLMVADNQRVRAGQVLAALKSSAVYDDVAALDQALARARPGDALPVPSGAALGDVQQPYTEYADARAHFLAFTSDPFHAPRMEALRARAVGEERLLVSMQARLSLLEEEAALAERDARRGRELAQRGFLSAQEAERAEAAHLAKRQALAAGRDGAAGQALRSSDLASQILDQEQRHRAEEVRLRLAMEKALAGVRESVRLWQVRYLLRAPREGRVSFFRTLAEGQYASPGEALLAVVPGGGRPTATVLVSSAGVGRVRAGQTVLLRFDGYSDQQFGMVEGRVAGVSLVPDQGSPAEGEAGARHRVTVSLPRGLRTSQGRLLELRQEMSGSADVVTQDVTVLQRLFEQLRGKPKG